jgi:DNA adenine methylase
MVTTCSPDETAGPQILPEPTARRTPPVANRPLRPPVKWHGGKYYLAKRIIELFAPHHTYVEPFGGAASVLLNKPPSPIEVYNDLDERLTRLFRVLRDHGQELQRRLSLSPYSEVEFDLAIQPAEDEIEQARRDFVRLRQSLGGRGDSFSMTLHRVRRGMPDVVSGYLSSIDEELPMISERLRSVQIVRRNAVDVIGTWDSPDTLFYCDPPYLHETRDKASTLIYRFEMDEDQHRDLAATLNSCQGSVVLSGYPSPLYDELYRGWRTVSFDIANHSACGQSKARKTEILWIRF